MLLSLRAVRREPRRVSPRSPRACRPLYFKKPRQNFTAEHAENAEKRNKNVFLFVLCALCVLCGEILFYFRCGFGGVGGGDDG